jgi:hypothetical protein
LPWLGPQTGEVLKGLGAQGFKHVMSVPLGFTSDHIETLYEVDHTYAEMAKEAGIEHFSRAPSLNDSPVLMDAMASIVSQHLDSGRAAETPQVCHIFDSALIALVILFLLCIDLLDFVLFIYFFIFICFIFFNILNIFYDSQYALNCPTCTNPDCRSILNPIAPYSNQRTANGKAL